MQHNLFRFRREFANAVRGGDFVHTPGGVIIKRALMLRGVYEEGIIGRPETFRRHQNLIPDEGILKILGLAFYTDTRITAWYLAPFNGSATPAANLTSATVSAAQSEITSGTEGYSQTTRVLFVPAAPAAGKVTNTASKGAFTIVTASALNITGSFLISVSTKGGTTGTLASCVKYDATRVVNNADNWGCGYEVTLTDS